MGPYAAGNARPMSSQNASSASRSSPLSTGPEVIEEHPTDTAALVTPVGVDEIVVAPGLEARIERPDGAGSRRACRHAVEVPGVVRVRIGGREVRAPAEPFVQRTALGVGDLEVAHVEMHGRDHRAARDGPRRSSRPRRTAARRRPPIRAPNRWATRCGKRRLPPPIGSHRPFRSVGAVGQHPGDAPAAPFAIPAILRGTPHLRRVAWKNRVVSSCRDSTRPMIRWRKPSSLTPSATRALPPRTPARAVPERRAGFRVPGSRCGPVPPKASSISCVRSRMTDGGQ